uniref:Anaphase-promoting complex subunit 4-like WD40 domain-containing protein n=1 Tax=Musa acuminata subsp. malaccensis TaxID=214687 RepID=A0A804HXD0_MUSAM|nr:PREDICTED: cell division cycle 20.2, cofactor of APC complex-like [Musa acuminata subsp. malaccensis]
MSRARARALVAGQRQESEGYRGEEDDWLWSLLGMWLQQHRSLAEDKGETSLSQRRWTLAKGSNNVLAIGLEDAVYLWDAANESTKLLQPVEDKGPITCIRWSQDCAVLAVSFGNSDLSLIDLATGHVVDGMEDENQAPVLSLAWRSNSILTVGRFDGTVVDYDFRKDDMFICFYNGHRRGVCSLKWSVLSGRYLAIGGQDKLVHIWDACMPVSRDHPRQRQWLHRISSHTSIVKAVDWCPTRSNLLAFGGGCNDHCVKFWNTVNGACLNSIDAGSEVCALL